MKYVICVGDGMADYPLKQMGDRTPLEVARTPHMDRCAREGAGGRVRTVPRGMEPGSDVANLSILGIDPRDGYTGRGPLEAASMGIALLDDEWAFRCNLVTVAEDIMIDYSGGHISSEEARVLIELLAEKFAARGVRFQPGISYRHLMIVSENLLKGGHGHLHCVPPHNITGMPIRPNFPKGKGSRLLQEIMQASITILTPHPVNKIKIDLGENPANMIWLWGGGKKPFITSFRETYDLEGAVISAVDLIKGIGTILGLDIVEVPGATGYYDTDYNAKADAALKTLEKVDFVFVHVEAPDEAGHNGDCSEKVRAIENFDEKVVGTLLRGLPVFGEYRMLVLPDHATPLSVKSHVADPVPFCLYGTDIDPDGMPAFNEKASAEGSLSVSEGWHLIDYLIGE